MIGWLNMWDRNTPSDKYGFAGMLTVPRRLEIKNGRLWQTPAVAMKKVYEGKVGGKFSYNIKIGAVKITARSLREFNLLMRKKGGMYTSFCLNGGEWVFDRSRSGETIKGKETDADSLAGIRRMPFIGGDETQIVIVMDEFSIEIFADGKSLSSTIYPDSDADGFELEVKAEDCNLQLFDI